MAINPHSDKPAWQLITNQLTTACRSMQTQMKSNKPVGNYTQWHFCVKQKAAAERKLAKIILNKHIRMMLEISVGGESTTVA